ncbi:hypothetical protein KIPB_008548 [Kipferlia bialata]|uniref:RRM domain-containing protein n=1 Tax=Kipferlia bialata TaxID=797122 RepID=A0A9K3GLJ3_9EUKA|nr:hypothetical protein KIPB_008548 [Kipferlia bialata]|eukprot:g8548.t1
MSSRILYIADLPEPCFTKEYLTDMCSTYGQVELVYIPKVRASRIHTYRAGPNHFHAFVLFSSRAGCEAAVLTLNFPPYAWCDEGGQINPPGYISDLWASINDLLNTDIQVVCGDLDTSFSDAVLSVSDNTYPVMTACGLKYERILLDILPTIGVDVSGDRY